MRPISMGTGRIFPLDFSEMGSPRAVVTSPNPCRALRALLKAGTQLLPPHASSRGHLLLPKCARKYSFDFALSSLGVLAKE